MIQKLFKIPTLSHVKDGQVYFENNSCSEIYRCKTHDYEGENFDKISKALSETVKSIKSNQRLGMKLKKNIKFDIPEKYNFRKNAIADLGYTDYSATIWIDTYLSKKDVLLKSRIPETVFTKSFRKLFGLEVLDDAQVMNINEFQNNIITNKGSFLDFGEYLLGAVCVYNKSSVVNLFDMARVTAELPDQSEHFVGIRKMEAVSTERALQTLANRQSHFGGSSRSEKLREIAEISKEIELNHEELIRVEQIILVKAYSEQELRARLKAVQSRLSILGDVMIETYDLPGCYFSTRVGGYENYAFHDISKNAISFCPFIAFKSSDFEAGDKEKSLVLHRTDESLHYFDLFNKNYKAFNAIIVGTTGSGKSVLTSSITQSILRSNKLQLIKIDVGGSYKKECEFEKGVEYELSVERPTGLNPFSRVSSYGENKSYSEALTHFLCELVKESNESELPKESRIEVSEQVLHYLSLKPKNPSITDFYLNTPDFNRKALLKQWIKGGLYEHTFSGDGLELDQKYTYFNFKSIVSAGSRDFTQGVMAAVILELNMRIYLAGDRFSNPDGDRIVLICDETKFFLDRNREFFLFTVSNFRKLGHGTIIINQDIGNFEFPRIDGSTDNSLINSSPIRILLQAQYNEAKLRNEFGLTNFQVGRILTDPYRGKEYREFVLQDDTGTRVCKLKLTHEEYLNSSSSTQDNEKISALMSAVPGLTFRGAIQCLLASSQ